MQFRAVGWLPESALRKGFLYHIVTFVRASDGR